MLKTIDLDWDFDDAGIIRKVISGLNAEFHSGQCHAVTGPSGCGKTTLLSILSLLCTPSAGQIHFRGNDLTQLSETDACAFRRESIGLVFQSFRLLETLNVKEQLLFAAQVRGVPNSVNKGVEFLEEFGVADKQHRMPQELSGGEKQRVALAQALMCEPPIVLADEPTAALDEHSTDVIADALHRYARRANAVVVVVSHDRMLIDRCDTELSFDKMI